MSTLNLFILLVKRISPWIYISSVPSKGHRK
jgi:hypothetical protein